MSYDIYLKDKEGNEYQLDEPLHEGGTRPIGGQTTTHINITWNYGAFYYRYLDNLLGIRILYGKKAKEFITLFEEIIEKFKDYEPTANYWDGESIGNCVKPLKILLEWCKKFPEGEFEGD